MAGRYFLRPNLARLSSICSISSRNFRNMIHVSIGSRSRSPESPLSFRMMSRADFIREPSCCVVVCGCSAFLAGFFDIVRFDVPPSVRLQYRATDAPADLASVERKIDGYNGHHPRISPLSGRRPARRPGGGRKAMEGVCGRGLAINLSLHRGKRGGGVASHCRIQQGLQFRNRFPQLLLAAKLFRNLHHVTMLRNRRHFQDFRDGKLRVAVGRVFLQ